MKNCIKLVPLLITLLSISCGKSKFTAANESQQDYVVNLIGTPAPASADTTKSADPATTDSSKAPSSKDSDSDSLACADAAGVNQNMVRVNGSEQNINLAPKEVLALRVTGNANQVNLKLVTSEAGQKLPAICLFLAGNQSHVVMDIGVTIEQIFVKARGNKALIEATVEKAGVIENLQVDAAGHEPKLVLKGEGKYPCAGNEPSVTCVKP